MSTTTSSHIVIIDLSSDDLVPQVLRRFDHHQQQNPFHRTVKSRKVDDSEDVEMAEPNGDAANDSEDSELSDEDESDVSNANILRIAISIDGQWLATSDDQSRTHIFNLDSIQVSVYFSLLALS